MVSDRRCVMISDMGIADAYLDQVGATEDDGDRRIAQEVAESVRDAESWVREEQLLRSAAQPVQRFAMNFALDRWPGTEAAADATWAATVAMARRKIRINRECGIDLGLCELNLELMDWIEARIGTWDDQTFGRLVRASVDGLLDARRRGRERGRRLRQSRRVETAPRVPTSSAWALRHPSDHYFQRALENIEDERLHKLATGQIDLLTSSYTRLADHPAAPGHAEMIIELEVKGPVPQGWGEPVTVRIRSVRAGSISGGAEVGLRLVADPAARFNGTLISLRTGEKWLTYADRLPDGTIVPADGTRRLAA